MNKFALIILILFFSINLIAQQLVFSKKETFQELDSLMSYIEEVHPNPYAKISKDSVNRIIEQKKQNLNDSINVFQLFTIISPIVSSLQDGHTFVSFPFEEFKNYNPICFPIKTKITNSSEIIVDDSNSIIPNKSKIISINNTPVNIIVETLLSSCSAEEKRFKLFLLNQSFRERFGTFFGFKDQYLIEFTNGERKDTVTLPGIKLSDLLEIISNKKEAKTDNEFNLMSPYNFKIIDNKTALIDFREFADFQQFESFLDSTFAIIKQENINNLIIDLRENGGGNSALGDELFQYISSVPFKQFGTTTTKYSIKRKQFYDSYRDKGFLEYLSDSAYNELFAHEPGSLIIENDTILTTLRENPLRFSGKVYLLTSIKSFSSAKDFAWCFRKFKMGTIVGEPTGGHIVSFGDMIFVNLPISNLALGISHREFYGYGSTDAERHSVFPDFEVKSEDALNFTKQMIEKY